MRIYIYYHSMFYGSLGVEVCRRWASRAVESGWSCRARPINSADLP